MISSGEPEYFFDGDGPPDWRNAAECVSHANDVNFFPARGESAAEAKAICAVCPVRQPCLDFALHAKVSFGIWGGLSERERRRVRRDRRKRSTRAHNAHATQ